MDFRGRVQRGAKGARVPVSGSATVKILKFMTVAH